jgi:hypothetical protein
MCEVFSFSAVKAQSSEATVLSYSSYVAGSSNTIAGFPGDLVVVGEIQNAGSSNLVYVDVAAAAYNSTGDLLASAQNTAYGTDLPPGQKCPFYIDFTSYSGSTGDLSWIPSVTNLTVSVIATQDTTESLYPGFSITGTNHNIDANGLYTVTGTLTNTGSQTSGSVWIVATFYNSSGSVVSTDFTNVLSHSMASGTSVSFTISPADNNVAASGQITNYALLVQSTPLASTSTSTATTAPTSTPTSTVTASTQPTVPSAANSISLSLEIVVIVLVVVIIAVVTALTLIYRHERRRKIVASETQPTQDSPSQPPASPETPPPTESPKTSP